jgi:hypothetical protein
VDGPDGPEWNELSDRISSKLIFRGEGEEEGEVAATEGVGDRAPKENEDAVMDEFCVLGVSGGVMRWGGATSCGDAFFEKSSESNPSKGSELRGFGIALVVGLGPESLDIDNLRSLGGELVGGVGPGDKTVC